MRYLPNFFEKNQLEKIFFCFPDPHFKAKNHRRRIISDILLTEYAYFLAPNARLYTVTGILVITQTSPVTKVIANAMQLTYSHTILSRSIQM